MKTVLKYVRKEIIEGKLHLQKDMSDGKYDHCF